MSEAEGYKINAVHIRKADQVITLVPSGFLAMWNVIYEHEDGSSDMDTMTLEQIRDAFGDFIADKTEQITWEDTNLN